MQKKKVVHFIHGLNVGGAETLVKNYALGIDKSKYDISILCYERCTSPYDKILADAGIDVLYACDRMRLWGKGNLLARMNNHVQLYLVLGQILRELKPDILHTHLSVNRYVKFAGLSHETKLFHTIHCEIDVIFSNKTIKQILELKITKWLVRHRGMRLIALHDDMKLQADEIFGVTNTIVLNNGIDFQKFENVMEKSVIRNKLNIPQNAFVLGHVGRFTYQKNHPFLLEVFLEVYEKNQDAYLLMVGDGEEISAVKNILNVSPAKNSYQILSNRSDVSDLLSAMDLFVFPSWYEGLSVALIEAQKMKLPCIVSNRVNQYTKQTDLFEFLPLEDKKVWVDKILDYTKGIVDKKQTELSSDWDMKNVILKLQTIYEGRI